MALRQLLTVPDPRLRIQAKPVEHINDDIRDILEDMVDTMHAEQGCGLAATQINIPLRLVVIDLTRKDETDAEDDDFLKPNTPLKFKMVNPEIIWKSDEMNGCIEGCLSVPEQQAEVFRPKAVRVRYQDEWGTPHEIESDDFFATCVQHEIDHLDGKLYIDYLSPLKRDLLIKKVKKLARSKTTP